MFRKLNEMKLCAYKSICSYALKLPSKHIVSSRFCSEVKILPRHC